MLVSRALRFAEPYAINDRSVIEFIANDRVLRPEQRLEKPAVRIERARIKNRLLRAEKLRQRGFQFLVNILRAANEAHTRHPEPVRIERVLRRRDQRRMIGQPEIIIRAHVEHALPTRDGDVRVLRRRDDALGFVETLRLDLFQRFRELLCEGGDHARG